ncbi:MAG: nitroreductase family protein [Spirochaetales bacterium]|nr:nitroreductase family protein [Spirochaetales bacterium]
MQIIDEIKNWVTIKKYTDRGVDPEVLDRILEAGIRAPSAKNRQPWRFIACVKPSVREKIQTASFGQDHVGAAPVIIAACTTNTEYKMPNGQDSYPIDISLAVSFMMIQARAEQLGTCVVTTYNEAEIKEILTVPYSMRVVMLLLLGHPDETPLLTSRKLKSRVISYNHW